jgi:signal transduction histidine kinase
MTCGHSVWANVIRRANAGSVRTRVTVLAGLALAAAVSLGLLIMFQVQVGSTNRTTEDQLRTYAAQIEQSFQGGAWPHPLPAFALDRNAQAQVLAADGTVLTATRALAGVGPVYTLPAGSTTPIRRRSTDVTFDDEVRVAGARDTVDGSPVTIITLTTTDSLNQINETFSRLLLIGVPGILLLACVTVWLVVGRALRPVERIRRTVTEITAADLSRRVPEPVTRDEIGDLARTMNAMLARLEDSAVRQRRFVADASHELRSPLAAIRTTLEVALAHPQSAPWPEIARRAARQSERLETLVRELLLLARSDDRHLVERRRTLDLGDLVEEVRATSASGRPDVLIERAGVADTPVRVVGDPEQLARMVRNILDNAVRHARHTVVVSVAESDAPDAAAVTIADDGPGIPPGQRERVFDRFVRLDPSRERSAGSTGLGLAIAKEIAVAHDGHITIGESPAGGALVEITLPRADD